MGVPGRRSQAARYVPSPTNKSPAPGAGGAWSLGDNAINAQLGACQVLAAVLWQSQNENPAEGFYRVAGFCPGGGSGSPLVRTGGALKYRGVLWGLMGGPRR